MKYCNFCQAECETESTQLNGNGNIQASTISKDFYEDSHDPKDGMPFVFSGVFDQFSDDTEVDIHSTFLFKFCPLCGKNLRSKEQ